MRIINNDYNTQSIDKNTNKICKIYSLCNGMYQYSTVQYSIVYNSMNGTAMTQLKSANNSCMLQA